MLDESLIENARLLLQEQHLVTIGYSGGLEAEIADIYVGQPTGVICVTLAGNKQPTLFVAAGQLNFVRGIPPVEVGED